jgi:hypothetical protein
MRRTVATTISLVAVLLMVARPSSAQAPITLRFDSLPSAQGWAYFQADGIPESRVFSVTGTSLIQDTIGTGFGNGSPNYARFGVVDGSKPFVLTVRARVLAYEVTPPAGAFGFFFDVRTAAPNQEYAIGLTPSLAARGGSHFRLPTTRLAYRSPQQHWSARCYLSYWFRN